MELEIIRSNRKSLGAEIKQGKLIIRAPIQATNEDINTFMLKNKKWIETHLAESQAREKVKESYHRLTDEEIQALVNKALEVIPERVKYYAPLIGVTYGRITIRNQRSKWGSCSSKGNLNFNCLLMLTPPEVIDSVVVHELCHRKEMNHSDKFYAEVLRVFPDYWKWDQWLKENGDILMTMMTATVPKQEKMQKIQTIRQGGWVFYLSKDADHLDEHKCGKWMYFFSDNAFAANICKTAVETRVVAESKHTDGPEGVCCFYLNGDDMAAHKRTIQFFLDNGLIQRTKTGRLYNISFKYDDQTRAGEYGEDFHGKITLDQFLNLNTGEWK